MIFVVYGDGLLECVWEVVFFFVIVVFDGVGMDEVIEIFFVFVVDWNWIVMIVCGLDVVFFGICVFFGGFFVLLME